ncbi:hypothetical protein LguiB_012719 [Lonicera macranthoides]
MDTSPNRSNPLEEEQTRDSDSEYHNLDRISDLHHSILSHILSFLPTKYAVATTTLSTTWKNLFATIPPVLSLDFDQSLGKLNPSFTLFVDSAMRAVSSHACSIDKFRLKCSQDCGDQFIESWINVALRMKLRQLIVSVDRESFVKFNPLVFLCKTLVRLTISSNFVIDNVPDSVCLPNLEILRLEGIKFRNGDSFKRLIRGCPVLDLLWVDRLKFEDARVIDITSCSALALVMENCCGDDGFDVVLDVPNIRLLIYGDSVANVYRLKNMNCVEAWIHIAVTNEQFREDSLRYGQNVAEFVAACSTVETLYLSTTTMRGFAEYAGFTEFAHDLTDNIPRCLSSKLEEIKVADFDGAEEGLKVIEFFLKSARVLRKMTISSTLSSEKHLCIRKKILMVPKCSANCEIELIFE